MTQATAVTNTETCAKVFAVLQHLLPIEIQVVDFDQSFQMLLTEALNTAFHLFSITQLKI
jgi:hypothetical protein